MHQSSTDQNMNFVQAFILTQGKNKISLDELFLKKYQKNNNIEVLFYYIWLVVKVYLISQILIIINQQLEPNMLQLTYELGDPLNDTFASPDTPDFSYKDTPSEAKALNLQLVPKDNSIMMEPFVLEVEEAQSHSGLLVNVPMIHSEQAKPSETEHPYQGIRELDDRTDSRPIQSKKMLMMNVAEAPPAAELTVQTEVAMENKENQPFFKPQLPVILEESSEKTIEQAGNEESIINVTEETHAQSFQSDTQEKEKQILKDYMIQFTIDDPPTQYPESLFWKIETLKVTNESKRHRIRPCQFWKGENVRLLKDSKVRRYQRTIQETFLSSPRQIQSAYTQSVSESMMKGRITMRPFSKLKVNQTGAQVILTSSRRSILFTHENNWVKIVKERGKRRLVLDNGKIESIQNTLMESCTVFIKMIATL